MQLLLILQAISHSICESNLLFLHLFLLDRTHSEVYPSQVSLLFIHPTEEFTHQHHKDNTTRRVARPP